MQFLASALPPDTDPAFFEHLRALDCSGVTVRALPEGSLAFPGVSAGGGMWWRGAANGAGRHRVTARPAGSATAGVRAAPGGAAAGDAAPLPGQLRQVGPGVGPEAEGRILRVGGAFPAGLWGVAPWGRGGGGALARTRSLFAGSPERPGRVASWPSLRYPTPLLPQPHRHKCRAPSPDRRARQAAAGNGSSACSGPRRGSYCFYLQLPGR